MNFDLTVIALLWLGGSVILLPLMIVAVRFAVVPLVEAFVRPRGSESAATDAARIARLEERVGQLAADLERLARTAPGTANS